MAVEAGHMNIFAPQFLANRDFIKTNQGNSNVYNAQMNNGIALPNTAMPEQLPLYQALLCDPNSAKASMNNKADSGLTYNIPAPKKRPRDSVDDFDALAASQKHKISPFSSIIDQNVIFQIQQQQSEIDRFIAEHTEKVRIELEERRKRQSRLLIAAIQEGVIKKLKEKDEEIQRMGKLNWVLQERVKSLYVENQIWRDLAQTNEATANSLRTNLEQVLAHVSDDRHATGGNDLADDAESNCGSCNPAEESERGEEAEGRNGGGNRMCRKCGERESSVLLLPCRHLCLCTVCGSSLLRACPVCNSAMNASVHVNMS